MLGTRREVLSCRAFGALWIKWGYVDNLVGFLWITLWISLCINFFIMRKTAQVALKLFSEGGVRVKEKNAPAPF